MKIIGVILAAGTSSRMGAVNKLLLEYKNHTIVAEVLKQMQDSEIDGIVVVTGFESDRVENALAPLTGPEIEFVYNGNYHRGRAESIKCAVRHIGVRAEAVLFMVADKPGVTSDLINRALKRFKRDRPAILHVETPVGRGHPIIFSRSVLDDLMLLEGDFCGDDIIIKYSHDLVKLEDDAPQMDIDSEADYRILLKQGTSHRDS